MKNVYLVVVFCHFLSHLPFIFALAWRAKLFFDLTDYSFILEAGAVAGHGVGFKVGDAYSTILAGLIVAGIDWGVAAVAFEV